MLASAGVGLFASSGDAGATPDSTGHAGGGPRAGRGALRRPERHRRRRHFAHGQQRRQRRHRDGLEQFLRGQRRRQQHLFRPALVADRHGRALVHLQPLRARHRRLRRSGNGGVVLLNGQQMQYGGTSWSSPDLGRLLRAHQPVPRQRRARPGRRSRAAALPVPRLGQLPRHHQRQQQIPEPPRLHRRRGYDRCTGIGVGNIAGLASALTPSTSAPSFTDGPPTASTMVNTAYTFTCTASGSPAPTFAVTSAISRSASRSAPLEPSPAPPRSPVPTPARSPRPTAPNPDATQAFAIAVNQASAFTNAPLSASIDNTAGFNFAYLASGFPAPTFAVTSGSLPPGSSSRPPAQSLAPHSKPALSPHHHRQQRYRHRSHARFHHHRHPGHRHAHALPPTALVLLAAALLLAAARVLPKRLT